jgi:hypothetical protein
MKRRKKDSSKIDQMRREKDKKEKETAGPAWTPL